MEWEEERGGGSSKIAHIALIHGLLPDDTTQTRASDRAASISCPYYLRVRGFNI